MLLQISRCCYGFSKNARFPEIKSQTKNVKASAFDKPSDFIRNKSFNTSTSNGFGSHSTRFQYYNTSKRHGVLPSANSYDTQPKTFSQTSNGWSFGVSRENIQKQHIERIIDESQKKIASPPPGGYEHKRTFGSNGIHYSMKQKLYRYGNRVDKFDQFYYDSQKKLPGPGSYAHLESIGKG